MEAAVNAAEAYSHIRAVMGMVVGLSLARLLTGLAGFVQHPKKKNGFIPCTSAGWRSCF